MPIISSVAANYQGEIRFIAVAGRSDFEASAAKAPGLFSLLDWGYDDSIWQLYGIPGQPASVLITGNDIVVDQWFGPLPETQMREALDRLVSYGV